MERAITSNVLQVHGVNHSAPTGSIDRIARLVSDCGNPQLPTAEIYHFRHERQFLQTPVAVKGRKNVFLRSNLNYVANTECVPRHSTGSPFIVTVLILQSRTDQRNRVSRPDTEWRKDFKRLYRRVF